MICYAEETNSTIVYALPYGSAHLTAEELLNTTSGGELYVNYIPLPMGANLLTPAWESIAELASVNMAHHAKRLLASIQETLSLFQQLRLDLSPIPQLKAFSAEDGSALFEWIFSDYRIGFNIDPNPAAESSWFLITNRNLGEITASGYIPWVDLNALIRWLLGFILSHS